jgi:hypothetical protein
MSMTQKGVPIDAAIATSVPNEIAASESRSSVVTVSSEPRGTPTQEATVARAPLFREDLSGSWSVGTPQRGR